MPDDGWTADSLPSRDACNAALPCFWHDVVQDLSGRETHGDVLDHRLRQADQASSQLLTDTESVSTGALVGNAAALLTTTGQGGPAAGTGPHAVRVAAVRRAVLCAAELVLGPSGAACCQHLSPRAEWQCAWLGAQLRVVRALRAVVAPSGDPAAAGLSLLPLWSCLKGIPGLRSPSPDVRLAAVQLLQEALLALSGYGRPLGAVVEPGSSQQQAATGERLMAAGDAAREAVAAARAEGTAAAAPAAAPAASSPAAALAVVNASAGVLGVSAWTVCRELICSVAARDTDPRVVAAALRAAAALLALCRDQCGAREWRHLVVEGASLAAGRAREGEVWSAAAGFAAEHGAQLGWRAAVRHLAERLRAAAAEPDGPLAGAADAVALCQALAGAAALEAAATASTATAAQPLPAISAPHGPPRASEHTAEAAEVGTGGAEGTGSALLDGAGGGAVELLTALAACVSDAARHGERLIVPEEEEELPPAGSEAGKAGGPVAAEAEAEAAAGQQRLLRLAFGGCVAVAAAAAEGSAAAVAGRGGAASGATCDEGSSGRGGGSGAPEEPAALAAAALAACCSLGCLLGSSGSLEAMEALVSRAEAAPLALGAPGGQEGREENERERPHSGPGGRLAASRAGLLAAAASLALGAAGGLCGGATTAAAAAGREGLTSAPRAAAAMAVVPSSSSFAAAAATSSSAATDAASQLAAAVRAVRLMRRLAALVQDPDKPLFSEVGGAPAAPTGAAVAAARQHDMAVAAALRTLTALLAALPTPLVMTLRERDGSGGGAGGDAAIGEEGEEGAYSAGSGEQRSAGSTTGSARAAAGTDAGRRPQVVIEELPDSGPNGGSGGGSGPASQEQLAASEWRRQQQELVPELVLLCATYAPPRGRRRPEGPEAAAAAAAAADPGLPPPPMDVFTPWAGAAVGAAAELLLATLHRRARPQPPPSRALRSSGSLALMAAELVSEQDVLAAALPELLRDRIRPVVVQRHVQSLEEGPIRPYTGPDTFARALAARRLAWLLMRSAHPFVGGALRASLPALLAACDDPAPGVAQYGVTALHVAAVECVAADLQWQRDLLLEQARRLVVGCQEQVWPLACPAAVALVRRIEGKDPRAPGYHRLAPDLLTEAERQAHMAARRAVFMPAAAHLTACLGLTSLRYTARLMPLLLEWLHAHDAASRLAALRLLAAVLRATWPRAGAHAAALWRHLLLALLRTAGQRQGEAGVAEAGVAEGGEGSGGGGDLGPGGAEEAREEQGAEEVGAVAAEARAAREVCGLLLACGGAQIAAFQPAEAGLPAGAERLHRRLLGGACWPAA